MEINAGKFGLAAGITTSLVYGIFATMLKLWPTGTLKFIGSTHFISGLELFAPFIKITLVNIVLGTLSHGVSVFLLFWVIVTIYNKLQSK